MFSWVLAVIKKLINTLIKFNNLNNNGLIKRFFDKIKMIANNMLYNHSNKHNWASRIADLFAQVGLDKTNIFVGG